MPLAEVVENPNPWPLVACAITQMPASGLPAESLTTPEMTPASCMVASTPEVVLPALTGTAFGSVSGA